MRAWLGMVLVLAIGSAAAGEVVELVNGDRLHVTILEHGNDRIVVEHPVLGTLTLPAEQVAAIYAEGAEAESASESEAEAAATQAEPEPEAEPYQDPQILGVTLLPGWDRRIELGIDGSEGNSETLNFRAAFLADYADERKRWHIGSAYVRQTTEGDKTRNDFFAEAIRDLLKPGERHFYFAQGRYDYDDFQSWRHRIALAGGVGYQFVESDDFNLIGRAGAGANYTTNGHDELTPEALLGIEGNWRVADNQTFEFKNTLYPSLGDAGEFRNLTSLAYVISMDHARGLSLKFGLENEYESHTDDDSEHNDLKYFLALVFDF